MIDVVENVNYLQAGRIIPRKTNLYGGRNMSKPDRPGTWWAGVTLAPATRSYKQVGV